MHSSHLALISPMPPKLRYAVMTLRAFVPVPVEACQYNSAPFAPSAASNGMSVVGSVAVYVCTLPLSCNPATGKLQKNRGVYGAIHAVGVCTGVRVCPVLYQWLATYAHVDALQCTFFRQTRERAIVRGDPSHRWRGTLRPECDGEHCWATLDGESNQGRSKPWRPSRDAWRRASHVSSQGRTQHVGRVHCAAILP